MTTWADNVRLRAEENPWDTVDELVSFMLDQAPHLKDERQDTQRQVLSRVIGKADYIRRRVKTPDSKPLENWASELKEFVGSGKFKGGRLYDPFCQHLLDIGQKPPLKQQWKMVVALAGVQDLAYLGYARFSYEEQVEILSQFLEYGRHSDSYSLKSFEEWCRAWYGKDAARTIRSSLGGGLWNEAKGLVFYLKKKSLS